MPVIQAVQTFTGIANENEFYGHHYLAEVFKGDIQTLIESWLEQEKLNPETRAPHKRLSGLGRKWSMGFQGRFKDDQERLISHAQQHQPLLEALGYTLNPQEIELQSGMPLPVWTVLGEPHQAPRLIIAPAYQPGQEDNETLDHTLTPAHYQGMEVPKALRGMSWLEIVSEALLGADLAPRWDDENSGHSIEWN
ncbi:MAG: hypothetical protein HQM12_22050 [SAR324 cluster bacterium]|nr:hypothetical protein [SAR324 cluster bacterium]